MEIKTDSGLDLTVSKNSLRTNYCFTYNNYGKTTETALAGWLTQNCKYAIYGHEMAPTTGTPHLQGYFSLKKQSRITTIQNSLAKHGIKLALFAARGNAQQNYDYCTKADPKGYFEVGSIIQKGKRSDLDDVADALRTDTYINVALANPTMTIKFGRGMRELKMLYDQQTLPVDRDLIVTVFYGDAGTGKTRGCLQKCAELGLSFYMVNSPQGGSLWYDCYVGQDALIIDDFYGWIKPHDLFRLLDRYPLQLPIKGSHVWAQYKYVFITSNLEPLDWYKDEVKERMNIDAFLRRLHNIYGLFWEEKDEDLGLWEEKKKVWTRTVKEAKPLKKVSVPGEVSIKPLCLYLTITIKTFIYILLLCLKLTFKRVTNLSLTWWSCRTT